MNDLPQLLFRQSIQLTALAAIVWLLVRVFAHDRPHLAHALWALVLLKSLIPPLIASPLGPFCWFQLQPIATVKENGEETADPRRVSALAQPRPASFSFMPPLDDHVSGIVVSFPERDDRSKRPVERSTDQPLTGALWHAATWGSWFGDLDRRTQVAVVWMVASMVAIGVAGIRLSGFLIRVHRRTIETPAELAESVARLSETLRVRRKVQVRVIDDSIGPAVIGIWRPTILLPLTVVRSSSAEQLQPLLAHEMIHIRRGDLLWALIQAGAMGLWWFHPLIRMAARRLHAEAERCCDEETVRCLGCKPAIYARALLVVLERKQRLRAVPGLPGVRPLEVTSRRLERIMRIGQGSHARSPYWVSFLLLAGAAIAVPGASWAQGDPTQDHPVVVRPDAQDHANMPTPSTVSASGSNASENREEVASPVPSPTVADTVTLIYDATGALAKIQRDEQCDRDKAQAHLKALVELHLNTVAARQSTSHPTVAPSPAAATSQFVRPALESRPIIKFHDHRMVVGCAADQQHEVQQVVDRIARHGTRQIVVRTRLITIPADQLSLLDVKWRVLNEKNIPEDLAKDRAATFFTSPSDNEQSPTLVSLVEGDAAKNLLEKLQGDRRTNVLQAPKITLFNAQSATVEDLVQRPFVVSVNESLQPVIRVVKEGLELRVRPTVEDTHDRLMLDCNLVYHAIQSVNEVTFKHVASPKDGGVTLQVPTVTQQVMLVNQLEVPLDASVLIAGVQSPDGKSEVIMMTMLDFQLVDPDAVASAPPVTAPQPEQYVIVSPKLTPTGYEHIASKLKEAGIKKFRKQGEYLQVELSAWQQAQPLVTQLLHTEQDDPYAGVVFTNSNDTSTTKERADLVIAAEEQATTAATAWLKAHGMPSIAIQGNVKYQVEEKEILIVGEKIAIHEGSQPSDFFLRGDRVFIRLSREEPHLMEVKLEGNAQVRVTSEQLEVVADEIEMKGECLNIKGNARLSHKGTRLNADQLKLQL